MWIFGERALSIPVYTIYGMGHVTEILASHWLVWNCQKSCLELLLMIYYYSDDNRYLFICCNHENDIINFLNMAGKWFVSRCFQKEETPTWIHFTRLVNKLLCGEKRVIKERLLECL